MDPPFSPYHHNFSIRKRDDVETALNDICHWIAYPAGTEPEHPVHVPAAVPPGGNYDNWMAVRGIHTSVNPWENSEYDIHGFWLNDPNPNGIGANSFKSATQFTTEYFHQMDVDPGDPCDGKWVAIVEPPEYGDVIARLVISPARFERLLQPVMLEKGLLVDGLERAAIIQELEEEDSLDVVQAAIDGVNEELIPVDSAFGDVFATTVAGEPLFVNNESGDYYLVPFVSAAKQKELRAETTLAAVAVPVDEKDTKVVVVVDAEDGSFKEASWVEDPVKYLPVSSEEALKLVLAKVKSGNEKPRIELVRVGLSPYYPSWKITMEGKAFFVDQDGAVSK
jgi:hypothetical protein